MSDPKLSHFDGDGRPHMVDVSHKARTARQARAQGDVYMQTNTLEHVLNATTQKGDVISIAELAGIMGSKHTSLLIPLCHPLPITSVKVKIEKSPHDNALRVSAHVKTSGQTGVEMEALTAVSTACLTIYDMLKAVDKAIRISDIILTHKTGGKSADWVRPDEAP